MHIELVIILSIIYTYNQKYYSMDFSTTKSITLPVQLSTHITFGGGYQTTPSSTQAAAPHYPVRHEICGGITVTKDTPPNQV